MYMFIMSDILTETNMSADDGGVSGVQADSKRVR
jgi:hypothetical protein